MLVTDAELDPLDDGLDVVIHVADDVLDTMVPFVRDMHASSGLTEAVAGLHGDARRGRDSWCSTTCKSHVPEPRSAPLCGNSIATDRGFLARDMPDLDAHLHYRMIDVSSIKELAKRWYPRVYQSQPAKGLAHRALADILESIQELRLLPARRCSSPPPGPTLGAGPGGGPGGPRQAPRPGGPTG